MDTFAKEYRVRKMKRLGNWDRLESTLLVSHAGSLEKCHAHNTHITLSIRRPEDDMAT